jgi:hypothetical protein
MRRVTWPNLREVSKSCPDRVFDTGQLVDQKLSCIEQSARFLRRKGFHMHGLEPAKADQLSDAPGIVAVRLHPHRRKRRAYVAGLHHVTLKPALLSPA